MSLCYVQLYKLCDEQDSACKRTCLLPVHTQGLPVLVSSLQLEENVKLRLGVASPPPQEAAPLPHPALL